MILWVINGGCTQCAQIYMVRHFYNSLDQSSNCYYPLKESKTKLSLGKDKQVIIDLRRYYLL